MTSVLAPQGVGLWGQNLRFTGAVGVAPAIPSDAYNRNSIGQRGGSVVTPVADVVGAGPSSSSRDPFNKQAATLIIRDEPKPRTLRDGFSGGEASFERGGIVTPIARTTLTEPEIKARLGSEGKSTRPASATPISLNDAIAMLRTAEETWPASVDGEPEIDDGYKELVSDAKRLKIIKGASMRRPITDEEQTAVTQIASKYASALGELSSDAVGVEAAAAAEDARPANQAASLAAAADRVNNDIDRAQNDIIRDAADTRSEAARLDQMDIKLNKLRNAYQIIGYERNAAVVADEPDRVKDLDTVLNGIRTRAGELLGKRALTAERLNELDRDINTTNLALNELDEQKGELEGLRVEPSRSSQMRAESTSRFAPHDRERARQAATMRGVMAPQFEESRRQAADLNTINRMQAADLNTINRMQAERIGTDAHDQRAAASLQAKNIGDAAYGQRATAIRNVDKNSLATLRQYARIGAKAGKQRADIADRLIEFVSSSAEETQQLLDDGIISAREDIAEALTNQGDILFELDENYKMGRKRDKAAAVREDAAVTRGNEVAAMEGRMATRYNTQEEKTRVVLDEGFNQMGSRLGAFGGSLENVATGVTGIPLRMVFTDNGRSSAAAGPSIAAGLRDSGSFRSPTAAERETPTAAERRTGR